MTPRSVLMAGFLAGLFLSAFWDTPEVAGAPPTFGIEGIPPSHPSDAVPIEMLVPHRGIYTIGLDRAETGSGVVGVDGAMIYKFAEGCDGWIAENQTFIRFKYEEERSLDSAWSNVSWESKDGLRYRFRLSQTHNDEPSVAFQGTATVPSDGGAGLAYYTQPSPSEVFLPPGTLFPTRHLFAIVKAGQAGALNFNRAVFDGTSPDNPYEVNAVITPLSAAILGEATAGAGLSARPGWNASLAFYPWQAPKGPLPKFQLHVQYRDDGIAEGLLQDYGDITLKLRLRKLELLPRPEC